ncbi:MAG: type II toxin-antitoxin system RelE/ParE family toxin [Chthoniobacteraceae bacterium]
MQYRIELAREPRKFLEALKDGKLAHRFSKAIDGLAKNPHPPGSLKMQGNEELYRIPVGDYRIIYKVQDAVLVVLVVAIGNRRDIYR